MTVLDDLHVGGLKIYRDTQAFAYGTDSVLLSYFAGMRKVSHSCDLCSGTGIIPLLMSIDSRADFLCVEIDGKTAELCEKSVGINGLSDRIKVLNADVSDVARLLPYGKFDLVTANPPYFAENSGATAAGRKEFARAEKFCSIETVCSAAKHLLRGGGRFCAVFPASRLSEMFSAMTAAGIEPKRLWTVSSKEEKPPYIVLVEGKKGAMPGLDVRTVVIHDENGDYSPFIKKIYKKAE